MYEDLKGILVEDLQVRAEDVDPAATREQVGLDSLAVLELASVLGDRFGIEIHDYELIEAGTVGEIARLVGDRCAGSVATHVPAGDVPRVPPGGRVRGPS